MKKVLVFAIITYLSSGYCWTSNKKNPDVTVYALGAESVANIPANILQALMNNDFSLLEPYIMGADEWVALHKELGTDCSKYTENTYHVDALYHRNTLLAQFNGSIRKIKDQHIKLAKAMTDSLSFTALPNNAGLKRMQVDIPIRYNNHPYHILVQCTMLNGRWYITDQLRLT